MEREKPNIDIIKNIATMEKLKNQLLSGTANLFSLLSKSYSDVDDRKEVIADIIIAAYLLSAKTGVEISEIDSSILNKLRLEKLNNETLTKDISMLYNNINNRMK